MTRSSSGMVVAAHHEASRVGAAVLADGGNAVDAAIAANAVMAVVYPQACGLGGDFFCQVWMAGEPAPVGYNGSGRAPAAASADELRRRGLVAMPRLGPLAVTVPGVAEAWEAVSSRFGSRPLGELLAPAIALARNGFAVTGNVSRAIALSAGLLGADPGGRHFLPGGAPPESDAILTRPGVAVALEAIAREGAAGFQEGPVAESIVAALRSRGGWHELADLAGHRGEWVSPISGRYRDLTIWELPPNTQGLVALHLLRRLDRIPGPEVARWSAAALSEFALAAVDAYALRDRHIADPGVAAVPAHLFLEGAAADAVEGPAVADGDTTYLAAADRWGNLVSLIQSNYMGFGSGVVVDDLGINLQNRGASFSLEAGHVNELAGGRRPRHTLIPAMASREGRPVLVFGCMGGEAQPQIHVNLLASLIDRGLAPQAAVDAGRLVIGLPDDRAASYEPGFPTEGMAALAALGFEPVPVTERGNQFGHAQVIAIGSDGYEGGADPRADSAVAVPES